MSRSRRSLAARPALLLALPSLLLATGCTPNLGTPNNPSSASVGSPVSRFCASNNVCPGMTAMRREVCGGCDPRTRYFRQSICALDEKVRKAVDSCVKVKAEATLLTKRVMSGRVKTCVKQRLENEPQVLASFTAIARRHKVSDTEQREWEKRCETKWADFVRKNPKYIKDQVAHTPAAGADDEGRRPRGWLWAAVGATAVAAGAGTLSLIQYIRGNDAYDDTPEFRTRRNSVLAGYIIGGIAAAGAALFYTLYFNTDKERPQPAKQSRLQLLPGIGSAALRWSF